MSNAALRMTARLHAVVFQQTTIKRRSFDVLFSVLLSGGREASRGKLYGV